MNRFRENSSLSNNNFTLNLKISDEKKIDKIKQFKQNNLYVGSFTDKSSKTNKMVIKGF